MKRKCIAAILALLLIIGAIWVIWKARDVSEFGDRLRGLDTQSRETEINMSNAATETAEVDVENSVAARFPAVQQEIVEIATSIMRNETPDQAALNALDEQDLNASFSRPFPEKQPTYIHTLLREAVLSENPSAAAALIAAGADPNFNDAEMPHLAVQQITAGRDRAFPDYSVGTALLSEWLAAGGDPNVHNAFYGSLGPLLSTVPPNNLEAQLTLLRAGADPWRVVLLRVTASGREQWSWSYVKGLANASPMSCEVAFRIGREGLIGPGPDQMMETIKAEYELAAKNYADGSGPEAQRTIWQLQMAVGELFPRLGLNATGSLQQLMSLSDISAYGSK